MILHVDTTSRPYVSEVLRANDRVRLGDMEGDCYCQTCCDHIGIDDEMYDLEGSWLEVQKVHRRYSRNLQCGGTAFSSDGWMWSTCWMEKFRAHIVPTPTWEV